MRYHRAPMLIRSFVPFGQAPAGRAGRAVQVYAQDDGLLLSVTPLPSGRKRLSLSLFSIAAAMHPHRDELVSQMGSITTIHYKAQSLNHTNTPGTARAKRVTVMDDGGYQPTGFYDGYKASWVSIGMMPGNSLNPSLTRLEAKRRWERLAREAAEYGLCLEIDEMNVAQQQWWRGKYRAPVAAPLDLVPLGTYGPKRAQEFLEDWQAGHTSPQWTKAAVRAVQRHAADHHQTWVSDAAVPETWRPTWEDIQNDRRLAMKSFILGLLLYRGGVLSPWACDQLTAVSWSMPPDLWPVIVRVNYERSLLENVSKRASAHSQPEKTLAKGARGIHQARRRI